MLNTSQDTRTFLAGNDAAATISTAHNIEAVPASNPKLPIAHGALYMVRTAPSIHSRHMLLKCLPPVTGAAAQH